MIFWIVLFALVVLISFLLALRSMADFVHQPPVRSVLFLIRLPRGLNLAVLNSMHDLMRQKGAVFSLERLIKGKESALVIYGPPEILNNFREALNLLELEDYTGVDPNLLQAWEIGARKGQPVKSINSFFKGLPAFSENEQLWWQLVLKAQNLTGDERFFQGQIRVVASSSLPQLKNPATDDLTKVPRPFTRESIIDFYQERSFLENKLNPILTADAVLKLISLV
ncbi:hypothetical protein HYU96_05020 [Candidatus Daviesbacteria bacterium]|nr:hypothetical protein [Candidatus Daviesbacteria bacterium]